MARSTMPPGVATMLEAARQFAAQPVRPKRSVLFIANTGEERGLLGADYYANHPTVPAASIVGLVDLDMPLLLYPFTDVIAFGADHSTIGATVAEAGRSMGIAVSPDPMPEEAIFTRSDHYMFVRRGRSGGAADDRPCQWRQGALGRLSRQDLSFAAGRSDARRSIGMRARATPCSTIASPGRWRMRRSGRCGCRATISATCTIPGAASSGRRRKP